MQNGLCVLADGTVTAETPESVKQYQYWSYYKLKDKKVA